MRDGIAMSKDEGMRDIEATRRVLDCLFQEHETAALQLGVGALSSLAPPTALPPGRANRS